MTDMNGLPQQEPEDEIAQVAQLADRIMKLTDESGMSRRVVGAALGRATAGFWARLTLDEGDSPEVAGVAVYTNAHAVADMAMRLLRETYQRLEDDRWE